MRDRPDGEQPPATFHPTRGDGSAPVKRARARELRQEMTPAERILWGQLRAYRARGFTFRRQQVIAGFIADFYCHPARLIIEVDGPVHARQAVADAEREAVFAGFGLRVLRVTNEDVRRRLPEVMARVEGELGLTP
jgi:very-short-patch-repair endonuclease